MNISNNYNSNIKISAIITAGGNSIRYGSNKLLEKINDLTVIETTISKFIELVDEIVIPASNVIRNVILNSKLYSDKIKFAPPGMTRQKSVYNGLLACSNPEIVLIHDGARPYIDKSIIKKAIFLTYQKDATVVGVSSVDTVKEVENGIIIKTLDRKKIFLAHTPQSFKYELIKNIHEKYKNEPEFTDDASMAEKDGIEVCVIEDLKTNIKITTRGDI